MKTKANINFALVMATSIIIMSALTTLKLTGYITLTWFWVFSPVLLPTILVGIILTTLITWAVIKL